MGRRRVATRPKSRRFVRAVEWTFLIIGGVVDVVALYGWAVNSSIWGWWRWSAEIETSLWMLTVAIGYPWATMSGALTVTLVLGPLIQRTGWHRHLVECWIQFGLLYAMFNAGRLMYGAEIKAEYLNRQAFASVVGRFFLVGLGFGAVLSLLVVLIQRVRVTRASASETLPS